MSTKPAFPSDAADKVLVRMPDGMRDQLKAEARANNRTMNAEIVARLQASFNATPEDAASKGDLQLPTKMIPLFDAEKSLKQYEAHLEEVLAKRDEKMRSWWQKEFGYDPQAPQVERHPNKGPAPSSNARKRPPKPNQK